MAFSTYESPPTFADTATDKETFVSAADLNLLRQNAAFLDMLSYRGRRAFTDQIKLLDQYGIDPSPLFSGSFQFRTGLEDAVFSVYALTTSGTHTCRISFDGLLQSTTVLTGGAGGTTQSITIAIDTLGYTDYQIVDVTIEVDWTSAIGQYRMIDAYVTPASAIVASSWPGVPTFGTVNAANLNQLANAQIHLMDRINAAQTHGLMAGFLYPGQTWVTRTLLYAGSISKSNGADRLRIAMGVYVTTNAQERIEVTLFSPTATTNGPTWTPGNDQIQYLFDIDISARTADTPFAFAIEQVVLTGSPAGPGQVGSRFIIYDIYTARASYSAPTLPALMSPRESLTYSTLQTRLGQIGTAVSNAYARVNGSPDVFNRIRLFRWRPGVDEGERTAHKDDYLCVSHRRGDALWVRGKNMTINYDHIQLDRRGDQPWGYEFKHSEQVISGDSVDNKLIYLDSLPGLYPGMTYWVSGDDIRFLGEHIR